MGYIVKGLVLLLVIGYWVAEVTIEPLVIIGFLLISALWIYREKYANLPVLMILEYILIIGLSFLNPVALVMCCVHAYDLPVLGWHWLPLMLLPGGFYFLAGEQLAVFSALLIFSGLSGYLSYLLNQKEKLFQEVYDQERRSRYSLEEAKVKLMNSAREAAHLAEIRERNRIARDIHDHIGHHLSGILLQLQVVSKVQKKDQAKAHILLDRSISGLAESVELLRDTVHNIKPVELMNIEYIKKIIVNYNFCRVEFTHSGDFASVSADYAEIVSSVIREALTNVNRHSSATLVNVKLDVMERIVRLHIWDNGRGCDIIREGMGISGMKERVRDVGGSITLNPKEGFSIVCVLPRLDKKGGNVLESTRG